MGLEFALIFADSVVLSRNRWPIGNHPPGQPKDAKWHAEVWNDFELGDIPLTSRQVAHITLMHVTAEIPFQTVRQFAIYKGDKEDNTMSHPRGRYAGNTICCVDDTVYWHANLFTEFLIAHTRTAIRVAGASESRSNSSDATTARAPPRE